MRALLAVCCAFMLACCAPREPTSEGADADAVRAVLTDITAAIAADDGARAAEHYAITAAMYRDRSVLIPHDIARYYDALARADGSLEFAPPLASVSASGDMAYVSAVYTESSVNAEGRPTYEEGDVVMVLLNQNGTWRIQRDARSPTVQVVR